MARKKLNSAAVRRSSPSDNPPMMVAPERLTPGIIDRHWITPTPSAVLNGISATPTTGVTLTIRSMTMIATPQLEYYQRLFDQCSQVMLGIQRLPVPVIARVHGMATAAGCQLVAQCDLAVASDNASFAVSGVKFGLFCSTPSVPLLRNVAPKHAMEMLLTGDFITAQQALERGLVNRVVAPEQLDAEVEKLVASILEKPRAAIAIGKELFYRQREMGIAAAYQLASQTMAVNMMDSCAQEGVTAFTEKRKPVWTT